MKIQKAWLLAVLPLLSLLSLAPLRAQQSASGLGDAPTAVPAPTPTLGTAPRAAGPQRPLAFAPSQIAHTEPAGQGPGASQAAPAGAVVPPHAARPPLATMAAGPAFAQAGPGYGQPFYPQAGPGYPPVAPAYAQPAMAAGPNPMAPMMGPMGPMGPMMGPVMPASFAGGDGYHGEELLAGGGCANCGNAGCGACGLGSRDGGGLLGFGIGERLAPFSEGGYCAPRHFDISFEAVYLTREDVGRAVAIMSDGPRGLAPPLVVLGSESLDFDDPAFGFRFNAALQLHAGGTVEFGYMGQLNWTSSAAVSSPNDLLYHVFSDFGNVPPPTVFPIIANGGYTDTDAAEWADLNYSSDLGTVELFYRKRWMLPNCRFQGSWIAGVRYLKLDEQIVHRTQVNYADPNPGAIDPITGFMNYGSGVSNSMTGFEVGGDAWVTVIPGVRLGSDLKVGLMGNHATQRTVIEAQSLANNIVETFQSDGVALVAEANLSMLWRINQYWTFKGGYELMYLDGVALAVENFNPAAPFGPTPRAPFINTNGDVFLHGLTAGFEYMW